MYPYKNNVVALTVIAVLATLPGLASATLLSFRNGVNGYTGTQDTELRQDTPGTNLGGATNFSIDGDDASGPLDDTNALLKFGGIFGNGPGQIPLMSTILSAQLELEIHSPGDDLNMLRMLVDWDESTATWNSLGNGIQAVAGEAAFARSLTGITGSDGDAYPAIDVLAEVAAWAGGADNFGWGFTPTGNDGVDFHASEHPLDGHTRPTLVVNFRAPGATIPEPASIALVGIGLLGLRFRGRAKT